MTREQWQQILDILAMRDPYFAAEWRVDRIRYYGTAEENIIADRVESEWIDSTCREYGWTLTPDLRAHLMRKPR